MRNRLFRLLFISTTLFFSSLQAQVTIGSNAEPHQDALLDLKNKPDSTADKGLLLPRVLLVKTTDKSPITDATPANARGMLVYNVATANDVTPGFYYWDGTQWVRIEKTDAAADDAWKITGNADTNPKNNFLGTTDDQDLVFKRGGTQAGWLNADKNNTFFGVQAGNKTTTSSGTSNTAVGKDALLLNTTGSGNTAFGVMALRENTTQVNNTAIGTQAMQLAVGKGNTALGSVAGASIQGDYNLALGMNAMNNTTNGSKNIVIGSYDNSIGLFMALTNNATNNIVIGSGQNLPIRDGSAPDDAGNNQLNIGGTIFGTGMTGKYDAPAGSIGINTTAPTATLHTNGSFAANIVATTANSDYIVKDTDYTIIANSNVILPKADASNKGRIYWIRYGSGTNITVKISEGEIVNLGSSSLGTLSSGNGGNRAYMLQSDGSSWYLIMRY